MAISLLGIVNALSPKDAGSRRVARDVPYGRLPRQALDIYAPRQASGPLPVVLSSVPMVLLPEITSVPAPSFVTRP